MAGRHVTVDATVKDPKVFSHDHLDKFFRGMCEVLNMEIIFGPVFKDVELDPVKLANVQAGGKFQDEGGTTGVVVISTSHIAIHTWEMRKFFQLVKSVNIFVELVDGPLQRLLLYRRHFA